MWDEAMYLGKPEGGGEGLDGRAGDPVLWETMSRAYRYPFAFAAFLVERAGSRRTR